MITLTEALKLSDSSFPNGPEAVAERIGAMVVHDSLTGCEGWCWQYEDRVVIYINSNTARTRQRFTLAHELAHVLQGTPAGVVRSEPFQSDVREERAADKLAGELLLPSARVISMIGGRLPIDADTLVRLGRAANVSPVTAACRVVGMEKELQMQNAAIAFFDRDGRYETRYSEGLTFPDSFAIGLMNQVLASANPGTPLRIKRDDGKVVFGSVIDSWHYKALLVQLLPEDVAGGLSAEERLRQLRDHLFGGDKAFEGKVAGIVGFIGNRFREVSVSEGLAELDRRYIKPEGGKLSAQQKVALATEEGREFLKIHLSKTCRPDADGIHP